MQLSSNSGRSYRAPHQLWFFCALGAELPLVLRTSGSLSLACARESNQREHTPGAALAASLRVREVMPGFARWTSVSIRELARILRATLAGESVMPSPRLTGTRDQKTDQGPYLRRRLLLGRAGCALLRLFRVPITLRRQRTKRPARVGAMDRADSAIAQGCAISGTRPLTRTLRAGARRAQCSGACLFAYFLCTSRESKPLARRASGSSSS